MLDIFAHNPDVQDKLRAELAEAQERYGEDIPHDELVALPYMDAFCRETMRMCVFSAYVDTYLLTFVLVDIRRFLSWSESMYRSIVIRYCHPHSCL